jgi:SAM-dependent methyltransferase
VREQRLVFGEEPELYDRARPGYSDALVDTVIAFGRVEATKCRALEVGAGTGKATVAFARKGVRVHGLEPDPAMAAVARRNTASYPGVEIEEASFEEWDLGDSAFDLVFSAQAWHWINPEVRCPKAAAALVPGGSLALFWHRVQWDEDDPVRMDLDECYRTYAPELYARGPGFPGLTTTALEEEARGELALCADFTDVSVREFPWEQTFDATTYVDRLRTQSDHRLLPADEREQLFGAVRSVIAGHGSSVLVPHSTLLVLGRRLE